MAFIFSRKKALSLCVAFLLIPLCLTGCGSRSRGKTIRPMELSKDQQELLDLIDSSNRQFLLFSYDLPKDITRVRLSVVLYEGGASRVVSQLVSELEEPSGSLVVVEDYQNPGYSWTLSAGSGSLTVDRAQAPFEVLPRAFGPIEEPVPIVSGEPIILFAGCFARGTLPSFSLEECQERPELLYQYEYAHVIQCTFLTEDDFAS